MTIDLTDAQLDALLKRLHLANARRAWCELVQRAEREEWSYRDFLALLIAEEIAHRRQTRIARMVRRAHFPFFKTIDDFNFSMQSTVRLALLGSALAADFVTEGRCLILGGNQGVGKRTSPSRSHTGPFRTASTPCLSPRRNSSTISPAPFAAVGSPTRWPATSTRRSWSATKWATSRAGRMRRTCSSMW